MNILDKIIKDKKAEVALKKKVIPYSQLENTALFNATTLSMCHLIKNSDTGIIMEHKRRSPSRDVINNSLSVEEVVIGYQNAGACGISVLTDGKYFGGSLDDLVLAKACCQIPILRKDFIVDEFQILEAKAHGADVILLIASVLNRLEIIKLSQLAKNLQLEVLLEVHNKEELENSMMPSIDLVGINNRNLKNFEVSLETSLQLVTLIPDNFLKISESGIDSEDAIKKLKNCGFQGFLMGDYFMKSDNPGEKAKKMIEKLITHE